MPSTPPSAQEYDLHVPYGAPALTGLQHIGIKVPNSVFRDPQVGDKIEVEIVSLTIVQEIRS